MSATVPWHAPQHPGHPRIGPAQVAGRYLAMAAAAIAVGALHLHHRPLTLCPFRALTGVPCPFCGGTTAAADLGHGHLGEALRASPLALGLLATWPLLGAVNAPGWWHVPRNRRITLVVLLVAAEIWQLVRFGLLPL